MTYATLADRDAIEKEASWQDRDVPVTTWELLCQTAGKHGGRPATTFQMFSDDNAGLDTLAWSALRDRTAQTANLLRSLGIGEKDVVAYVLPNSTEAILTYLGGQVAGIVNPIRSTRRSWNGSRIWPKRRTILMVRGAWPRRCGRWGIRWEGTRREA